MADSQTHAHFLNPWALHLQKLGLELKCPFCLNLYSKPTLLPCNHIFCSSCVPKCNLFGSECPICKLPYVEQELRHAPYMENVVNIYRCLDASFSTHVLNSAQCSFPAKTIFKDQSAKSLVDNSPHGNSTTRAFNVPLTGTQQVQVLNNSSVMANLEKGSGFDIQTFNSNPSSMIPPLRRDLQQDEHEAVDVNQMELSPDSPPSSAVSKGVETDSRDPASSYDTADKRHVKKSAKRSVDAFGVQGINECQDLYLKKQKQLSQGQLEMHEGNSPPSTSMNLEMNAKSRSSCDDPLAVESDSTSLVNFVCAFCHTWKITEGTGLMQHFANGKQVFGNEAGRSNVMHVHKSCIEWAPQIFYESDNVVKNLDKELARAGKLKCTKCGFKGAALGCYAKSCRRSYHVPCAFDIVDCRWDSEEFLMLCPSHSSHKFPSEKFRKAPLKNWSTSAQICNEQKSLHESEFWASPPTGAKNWVLCGSALSADEKLMLVKFGKLCGATVTKAWNPNVTHVIAATDANGACSRTLKVLMAILQGRWVLKTDWIITCMQSKCPVDEEPYEISLDNHGCCGGPRTGRLRALNNAPQLFSGLKFMFTGEFVPTYKSDIEDLITGAGGTIVEGREQSNSNPSTTTLVIYNNDVMIGMEDACEVSRRQVEAERVGIETGSQVIAHTWILDSIASCALQPLAQR